MNKDWGIIHNYIEEENKFAQQYNNEHEKFKRYAEKWKKFDFEKNKMLDHDYNGNPNGGFYKFDMIKDIELIQPGNLDSKFHYPYDKTGFVYKNTDNYNKIYKIIRLVYNKHEIQYCMNNILKKDLNIQYPLNHIYSSFDYINYLKPHYMETYTENVAKLSNFPKYEYYRKNHFALNLLKCIIFMRYDINFVSSAVSHDNISDINEYVCDIAKIETNLHDHLTHLETNLQQEGSERTSILNPLRKLFKLKEEISDAFILECRLESPTMEKIYEIILEERMLYCKMRIYLTHYQVSK